MLYDATGKPAVAVVSIAHLGDAERMMVVSLVLNALLEWTRRQTGTGSLRALLYMDEVFGYLPPVANPPSKLPLLTLLKQARAFGVGIVLATQNPVDLDYKALSNTGTWFLGQAPDRARQGPRAGRPGGCDERPRPRHAGQDAVVAQEARVPHAQRPRQRASGLRDAVDAVVSAGPDGTRRAQARGWAPHQRPRRPTLPRTAAPPPTGAPSSAVTAKQVLPANVREFYLPATGALQSSCRCCTGRRAFITPTPSVASTLSRICT